LRKSLSHFRKPSDIFIYFILFYFSHGATFIIFPMAPYFIYFPHHPTLVYISTLSDRNVPILFSLDILSASGVSYDLIIFIFSARFRSRPNSRPYRARKPQMALGSLYNYSQFVGNRYCCYKRKNGNDWFTPHISMSKFRNSPPILWLPLTSTSTKNQGKSRIVFLILITSQIINLKIVEGVLGSRKCY
jgi:hypothetical protein